MVHIVLPGGGGVREEAVVARPWSNRSFHVGKSDRSRCVSQFTTLALSWPREGAESSLEKAHNRDE